MKMADSYCMKLQDTKMQVIKIKTFAIIILIRLPVFAYINSLYTIPPTRAFPIIPLKYAMKNNQTL